MAECPICEAEFSASAREGVDADLVVCERCLNPLLLQKTDGPHTVCERIPGLEDMRSLAPPDSVMADVLAKLMGELENLPVLPEIPQRCMVLLNDPLTSMKDLAELVAQDAALGVRILRVANSAFYGGTHEVKDIQLACSRLGLRTIGNLVLAAGNQDFYHSGDPELRDMLFRLWKHAIATAHCADRLVPYVEESFGASLFLAGLVHDIGKVILLDFIKVKYQGRVGRLKDDPAVLVDVLNQFHNVVGLLVAKKWNLPTEVCVAVLFHDDPGVTPSSDWQRMVGALALASSLAEMMGYRLEETQRRPLHGSTMACLGLSIEQVKEMFTDAHKEIDALIDSFALN